MFKAAKKTIRYSLIFLILLLVVLLTAPFFIDANRYKTMIVGQAEKAIGRHIEIGELHASLFPWVGVRINDVHIANPQDFGAGDMLQAKSLDVQVAVLPLLGGKYKIERFVLDGPKLQLGRTAEGISNWEDLLPAATPKATAPAVQQTAPATTEKAGNSFLAALSARSLRMKDGEVHFNDVETGRNIDLTGLDVEVNDVQMQRPVDLSVSGKVNGDAFTLDGMAGPANSTASIDLAHLPLKGHLNMPAVDLAKLGNLIPQLKTLGAGTLGLDAQLEQRPSGVRVMAGSLKLHASHDVTLDLKAEMPDAQRMQIEQMQAAVDGNKLADISGTVTGIGGKLAYQLRINTPQLTRQQLSQWWPSLQSMYAANPSPWNSVQLGMLAAGDTQQVDIRDLQLMLNNELVQASGNINYAGSPDIRLRVASRLLHVDPWLPQPAPAAGSDVKPAASVAPATISSIEKRMILVPAAHAAAADGQDGASIAGGAANADAGNAAGAQGAGKTEEPDLRFLKSWKIAALVQVDDLFLRGLDLSRLQGNINGRNGVINIDPLRFDLAGGHVEEQASLNVGAYPATWSEAVKLRDVQLQPVLKALTSNDILSGKLQMDTRLSGRGLLPEAALSRLNGNGNVLLRDGSIKGVDIAATLRNLRNFGQGGGEQKTDFSQMSGSFNITNGVAKNDDLFVASPLFRLTGFGVVNLPSKQLDYHLKPRLVGTLIGQGDTDTVRKGLEVPLHLTGPLDKPKVTLEVDLQSLINNRAAIQQIIKNPKGALQGLLGGAVPGQSSGNQGAASQNQPAQIKPQQQTAPAQPTKPLDRLLHQVLPGL